MTGKHICVFGIIAISTLRKEFFFFLGRSGIVGVIFAQCLLMGADIVSCFPHLFAQKQNFQLVF